jgi:hypothetical protein
MSLKQLTIFVENKKGALVDITKTLADNNINMRALSIADTEDFGILRLIVDNAEKGKEELTENGFSSLLSDVLIIEIPHKAGSLQSFLKSADASGINIEYMYGLSIESKDAYVVLKASDNEKLVKILAETGIRTLSCEDLKNI